MRRGILPRRDDLRGNEAPVGLLHELVLLLGDLAHLVEPLQLVRSGLAIHNAPLDVAQKLDAARVEERIVRRIGLALGRLGLVVFDGTLEDPIELKGKVQRLLRDDEGEALQDGIVPAGLEVDDHVGQLGEVELHAVEDVARACVLGHELRHELHHRRVVPKLPDEHHHLLHGHLALVVLAEHIVDESAQFAIGARNK